MTLRLAPLLLAATLVAVPAAARDKKPVDPNKNICRSYLTTGSIMPGRRTCHTYAEWQAIDSASQSTARRLQDSANQSINGRQ